MLFSEEELWNVSGMRLGKGFVEVTCGWTICRFGNAIRHLPFYPSGELEINRDCTQSCHEGSCPTTSLVSFFYFFISCLWMDAQMMFGLLGMACKSIYMQCWCTCTHVAPTWCRLTSSTSWYHKLLLWLMSTYLYRVSSLSSRVIWYASFLWFMWNIHAATSAGPLEKKHMHMEVFSPWYYYLTHTVFIIKTKYAFTVSVYFDVTFCLYLLY
jgi:hypothetical protein